MSELSARQSKIFDYIRTFIDENDYPPSVRDIQRGCGISSTSVVDYNLRRMEEKGLLERDREVSRGIKLAGRTRARTVDVPVLGAIAAGQPIPVPASDRWRADVEDTVTVTEEMLRGRRDVFALRVKGESMIEDLIDDGDIVFLEPAATADDGEKVAVWLEDRGEVTLKRLYREGDRIRLQPANSAMPPIYADAADVRVQGRFITSIRPSG